MSEWAPKRFWTQAAPVVSDTGWTVTLDGRAIKTPAKTLLQVPTEALAREIAAEWNAQQDKVNPATMPFTRTSNSALDKVTPQRAEVADMLAAYGDSDLLCYRADSPAGLVARQARLWDPMLDWAENTLGVGLKPRTGIMHVPQDPASLSRLAEQVHALNPFELAAFHDLVSLTGSLILGFAAAHGGHDPQTLWTLSRVDENWQEEQWGVDEEAQEKAEFKRGEFLHAEQYFRLSQPLPA